MCVCEREREREGEKGRERERVAVVQVLGQGHPHPIYRRITRHLWPQCPLVHFLPFPGGGGAVGASLLPNFTVISCSKTKLPSVLTGAECFSSLNHY